MGEGEDGELDRYGPRGTESPWDQGGRDPLRLLLSDPTIDGRTALRAPFFVFEWETSGSLPGAAAGKDLPGSARLFLGTVSRC